MLMQLDPYPKKCPNEECDKIDTHLLIENHFSHECPYTKVQCQCGTLGYRKEITDQQHRSVCVFYQACQVCNDLIFINNILDHYETVHHMKLCRLCQKPTGKPLTEHLRDECMTRLVQCTYCSKYFTAKDFSLHCFQHINDLHEKLEILKKVYHQEQALLQKMIENMK
jgi:hypothetical protein